MAQLTCHYRTHVLPIFQKIKMNVPQKCMQSRWRNLATVTIYVLGAAPSLAFITFINTIASTILRKFHRLNMFDRRLNIIRRFWGDIDGPGAHAILQCIRCHILPLQKVYIHIQYIYGYIHIYSIYIYSIQYIEIGS